MWNEFLPISMPITAGEVLSFRDMACSFFRAPYQHSFWQAGSTGRNSLAVLRWAEIPRAMLSCEIEVCYAPVEALMPNSAAPLYFGNQNAQQSHHRAKIRRRLS
jgi:hypothetical protein